MSSTMAPGSIRRPSLADQDCRGSRTDSPPSTGRSRFVPRRVKERRSSAGSRSRRSPNTTDEGGEMERSTADTGEHRGSGTAFRIVAGILGVGGIALSLPFTIISFVDDAQAIHRLHNVAFTALYGVLLGVALLACARRPEANVSSFFVAVASGIAGSFRESGRRLGAWLVGIAAETVGVGSLLLSDYAGALDAIWAWLTAAW